MSLLGQIGRLSLGLSLILSAIGSALAIAHRISWALFGYAWVVVIALFALEVVIQRTLYRHALRKIHGPSFAVLCLLMSASLAAWVFLRITTTFTGGVLPWDTAAFVFPVSGQVASARLTGVSIQVVNTDLVITGSSAPLTTYHGLLSVRSASIDQAHTILTNAWDVQRNGQSLLMNLQTRNSPFAFSSRLTDKGILMVQVPMQASISVQTINGNITINHASNGVTASTLNGSIELSDVTGAVQATTLTGQVVAHHIHGTLVARTSNGNIVVTDASESGRIKDVNGSISASFQSPVHSWSLTTVNGDIHLNLPKHVQNMTIHATAPHLVWNGGHWHFIGKPLKHDQTVQIGRGMNQINLSTASGTVHVKAIPSR